MEFEIKLKMSSLVIVFLFFQKAYHFQKAIIIYIRFTNTMFNEVTFEISIFIEYNVYFSNPWNSGFRSRGKQILFDQ